MQTHLACRFDVAVDVPGLRWSGAWSQIIDQPQDFPNQIAGHGDFRQLERDIAAAAAGLS